MDLCNGHCGSICDDTDEEEDSSPVNSPVSTRKIVPSPPLPPRRPSPSPTPNNHTRNGRHLTVPKENAPPPPSSAYNSNATDNQPKNNSKLWTIEKGDKLGDSELRHLLNGQTVFALFFTSELWSRIRYASSRLFALLGTTDTPGTVCGAKRWSRASVPRKSRYRHATTTAADPAWKT